MSRPTPRLRCWWAAGHALLVATFSLTANGCCCLCQACLADKKGLQAEFSRLQVMQASSRHYQVRQSRSVKAEHSRKLMEDKLKVSGASAVVLAVQREAFSA